MISNPEEPSRQYPEAETDSEADAPESKSQRKRNAHQITELAGILVDMKPKVLAALPLEPRVFEAVRHCAEIKAHGARKRQLHFASKLLRESDNIEELLSLVMQPKVGKKKQADNPHLAFRNKLLEDFAGMVEELRHHYPGVELQQVRQLVRNAQTECMKASTTNEDGEETKPTPDTTKSAKSLLKLLTASRAR